MKSWKDLTRDTCKYETDGYERLNTEDIIGTPVLILDYETCDSAFGDGTRILIKRLDNNKTGFITTYASVINKVFRNSPKDVKELIDKKVEVTFKTVFTQHGKNPYLTME